MGEEETTVDFAGIDVFEVDDVMDMGGGMPLFKDFSGDDWTMLGLRHELHLLMHAFRRDVNDPERLGIHLDHLPFYYNKYYKKSISAQMYGKTSFAELLGMVRDVAFVTEKQVLEAQLDDEMESLQIFIKLTEEDRRERHLRLDLGDESARLKIQGGQNYGNQNRGWNSGGGGDWKQGGRNQNWGNQNW